MNEFMKRAVEIATVNGYGGGHPFGAVLIKDGKIIAEGVNQVHKKFDISAHAEIVAIRNAQEKLKTYDLSNLIMYVSAYPCPLCWTAMYIGGITKVYYIESNKEVLEMGLPNFNAIYADLAKPNEKRRLKMIHMPLKEGMEDPLKLFTKRQN